MALTADVLKANEVLSQLTDEQLAAITVLSANDEATVINTKIGEHHGLIEKDVAEVTGIAKKDGEKSYEYMKRVLTDFKTQAGSASTLQNEVAKYKQKIAGLEEAIAKGNTDAEVAQKLKDTQSKLNALQEQYEADKTGWQQKESEYTQKITGIQVTNEFSKALSGVKFKKEYPDSVVKTLTEAAKAQILAQYKPDWIEVDGTKTMVFRDAQGEILRNKANGLNPYTAEELIKAHDSVKAIIDTTVKKPGAGTGEPGKTQVDTVDLTDISGAKTQVQADKLIEQHLMQLGFVRGTADFADKHKEIRTEHKVNTLPIR